MRINAGGKKATVEHYLKKEVNQTVIHILPYESFRFFDINGSSILKIQNSAYKIVRSSYAKRIEDTLCMPEAKLITPYTYRVLPIPYYPAEKHHGEEQHKHSTEERTVERKSESLSFSPTVSPTVSPTCLCSGLRLLSCRVTSPLRGWRNKKNGHG